MQHIYNIYCKLIFICLCSTILPLYAGDGKGTIYKPIKTTKTTEKEESFKVMIFSPELGFAKYTTIGLDLGFGIKSEFSSGGCGMMGNRQIGLGYVQTFQQHKYFRAYAEFDMAIICGMPPPSLSFKLAYTNGYLLGTHEQYIVPEIGYHLIYGDLSVSFPIKLQETKSLYTAFTIRGHIFAKIKKQKK